MSFCRIFFVILCLIHAQLFVPSIMPGPALAAEGITGKTQYFSLLQDIPLMPGLAELDDQAVTFDTPAGRIVESVVLLGGMLPEAVLAFYFKTLPQLGWAADGPGSFEREGEKLRLIFEKEGAQKFMRLTLGPATLVPGQAQP